MPVIQPRPALSEPARSEWLAAAASVLFHAVAFALVLLLAQGTKRGDEEESAPAFAIQFDSGATPDQPPTAASQPRVSLGDEDEAPPPTPAVTPEPEAVLPPIKFGSALAQHHSANPFAHITPFNLSQSDQRRSLVPPGSRGLDLSAGPTVRNGQLVDSVQHVRGSHGYQDYGEEIRAFADAHKYYPQQAIDNREEGAATLEITVARDGTVKHLRWLVHSGSASLDAAWYSVFADNKLPPMNDDMPGNDYTFSFELDYSLIYGAAPR